MTLLRIFEFHLEFLMKSWKLNRERQKKNKKMYQKILRFFLKAILNDLGIFQHFGWQLDHCKFFQLLIENAVGDTSIKIYYCFMKNWQKFRVIGTWICNHIRTWQDCKAFWFLSIILKRTFQNLKFLLTENAISFPYFYGLIFRIFLYHHLVKNHK